MTSVVRPIPVALIDAGDRLRLLDPAWVQVLAEDIRQDGLQEPIRLVERGERFRLISGARRLAAVQLLGHDKVRARVAPATAYVDEASIRLAEIKADMLRAELMVLERAQYLAAWRDVYLSAHEVSKGGRPRLDVSPDAVDELSAKFALSFSEAAQSAFGISRRSVFLSLKIASIPVELRHRIALHPVANVQRELLLLADQEIEWQASVVSMLLAEPAEAETVAEALIRLKNAPAPQRMPVYERFQERFAVWKPAEKVAFFELNAEEIDRWNAQRAKPGRKAVAR